MNRFKLLRVQRGITQEEFRKQFNERFQRTYTPSAISQFENGKRIPETSALIDFADFYGVTIDYLLGHRTEGTGLTPDFSENQINLVKVYDELEEEDQREVFKYIDFLKHKRQISQKSLFLPNGKKKIKKISY